MVYRLMAMFSNLGAWHWDCQHLPPAKGTANHNLFPLAGIKLSGHLVAIIILAGYLVASFPSAGQFLASFGSIGYFSYTIVVIWFSVWEIRVNLPYGL